MSPEELEGLLSEPSSARELVQRAVMDPQRCDELSALALSWLDEATKRRALALHLIRALNLRASALELSARLDQGWIGQANPLYGLSATASLELDGVSRFASPVAYHASPTLAETALRVCYDLIPQAHPRYQEALSWGLSSSDHEPQLLRPLWEAWPAHERLTPLLPHLKTLLSADPSIGRALAIRVALFHPNDAPIITEGLSGLDLESLAPFRESLEKQLMRVKRVKLWVTCRESLNKFRAN